MPITELLFALAALLLAPGPTNTLMALAGAERGAAGTVRLVPVIAAAYLITTLPLALAGAGLLASLPPLRGGLTLAAALWVAWLAIRLWRQPAAQAGNSLEVSALQVFTTTLLNPKALIIGLVLLPAPSGLPLRAALLAAMAAAAGIAWALIGQFARLTASGGGSGLRILRRGGAVWLAVLSAGLAVAAGSPG